MMTLLAMLFTFALKSSYYGGNVYLCGYEAAGGCVVVAQVAWVSGVARLPLASTTIAPNGTIVRGYFGTVPLTGWLCSGTMIVLLYVSGNGTVASAFVSFQAPSGSS